MRKIYLSTVDAALVMAGTSAIAADLRVAAPAAPAAAVMAPVYDWNGLYIGVQGGYSWGTQEFIYTGTNQAVTRSNGEGMEPRGGLIGGTLGYNYHTGPYLFGVEGDYAWADISRSAACPNAAFSCRASIDSFGTARFRAGMVFDNVMIYGTAGLAFGEHNVRTVRLVDNVKFGTSKFQVGWTAGAGVEWGFAPNWSIKAEALYFDLMADRYEVDAGLLVHAKPRGVILRGGLNWRFNWGAPPVMAAY